MSDQIMRTIAESVKDSWKLSMTPSLFNSVKTEDILNSYSYLTSQSKVHLLLQLSVLSVEYAAKFSDFVEEFIQRCFQDEDEWVSYTANVLFSSKSGSSQKNQIRSNSQIDVFSSFASNGLFSSSVPSFLRCTPKAFGEWEKSIQSYELPKPTPLTERVREPPKVVGKVGTLRKRNRVETAEPPTSESKKPRRISVATGEKHKRQAPETSEKSKRSSIDLPAEKRKRSISETTERNRSEKPMKIVVKSDPVPPGDTGDLKPLKVGSDSPFVTLTVDPHVSSRVEESWSQLASRIKSLEEPEWENPNGCVGFFGTLLRQITFDSVMNEVGDILNAFVHGREPQKCSWRKGGEETKEVDLVVSVKENPHRILVLRLGFKEYTWELVGCG
ncbi:hypothetical protein WA588_001549, partial [Blastocystis sp. NMH]